MKCDKHTMLLYAVTDRAWVGEQTLYQQVESALKGGATCVQPVSYTHLTLPTSSVMCRSRWSPPTPRRT